MKTTDLKIAIVLFLNAVFAVLLFACCKEESSSKMLWTVSSTDQNNVEISFNPSRRPQIEIVANAEGGECQLSCPNYEHISFRHLKVRPSVHEDQECQFQAVITAPGIITVNLDKMTEDSHDVCAYFIIDGDNGRKLSTTVVKVTRKLQKCLNSLI